MRRRNGFWAWCLMALGAVHGCGQRPSASPDTGSREAATGFYKALCERDWPKAYAALAPESRRRFSAEQFARLANGYRKAITFAPEAVHVRAHEEHGAEAVVHVVFTGQAGGRRIYFKDAITLRRGGAEWGVILPPRFGQARLR